MRISDWSSDVCSSDLARLAEPGSEITVATLAQDETIRRESTPEKLASLKRVFRDDGRVSAGNASQICDGAAAVLLMRADKRSEERRVGQECVRSCRSRLSPDNSKQNNNYTHES